MVEQKKDKQIKERQRDRLIKLVKDFTGERERERERERGPFLLRLMDEPEVILRDETITSICYIMLAARQENAVFLQFPKL